MGQDAEALRRDIANTRAEMSGTIEAIGDRVSPGRMVERRKNRMANSVRSVKDRIMGTASGTGHKLADTTHSMKDTMGEKTSHLVESAKDTPELIREQTEGAPMIAGAIAFGVGFLTASVIPLSSAEERSAPAVREKLEPVKQELSSAAHEVAEHLKEPVGEATSALKESVSEGVKSVNQTATQVTDEVKSDAMNR